jgi:bilin biosynthesis protein
MPTLEQITDPVFSADSNRSLHREFVPFNEELTAEMFADEINSGRMSVEDAYNNFWSYKEDAKLWRLQEEINCREILPRWKNILNSISEHLNEEKVIDLFTSLSKNYVNSNVSFNPRAFNVFEESYRFALEIASKSKSLQMQIGSKLMERLETAKYPGEKNTFLSYLRALKYYDRRILNYMLEPGGGGSTLAAWAIGASGNYSELVMFLAHEDRGVRFCVRDVIKEAKYIDDSFFELLNHPNKEVQQELVELITQIGNKQHIARLIDCAKDFNSAYREYIINELGEIECIDSVDFLLSVLTNEKDPHRVDAAKALGYIGNIRAADDLVNYLNNKNNPKRDIVATALGNIAVKNNNLELAEVLIGYIDDNCNTERWRVARCFGELKDKRAEDSLIRYLLSSKDTYKSGAAIALGRIGSEKAICAIEKCLSVTKGIDVEDYVVALGMIGTEHAINLLVDLLVKRDDFYIKNFIVDELYVKRNDKILDNLINLIKDKNCDGREWAAWAIGRIFRTYDRKDILRPNGRIIHEPETISSEKAVEALEEYILDKNNPSLELACESLGSIASDKAAEILIAYLKDKTNQRREYAAKDLCKTRHNKATNALIEYFSDDSNDGWNMFVDYTLHEIAARSGENAINILKTKVRSDNVLNRHAAINALAKITSAEAIKLIEEALLLNWRDVGVCYREVMLELSKNELGLDFIRKNDLFWEIGIANNAPFYEFYQQLKPKGYIAPDIEVKLKCQH